MVSCNRMGALVFIYLIRYNTLCLAGRELSRWAWGDEKHDKARICSTLEKVSACCYASIVSSFCIFIDDFLDFWNCYWPQEKQWVFSRCFHLPRSDKVCLRTICRHILLPRTTKIHVETTPICSCGLHYRHHQQGRWQSRIGRVAGNKDLYLGTFSKKDIYLTVDL
jgi:hypothetical protein